MVMEALTKGFGWLSWLISLTEIIETDTFPLER